MALYLLLALGSYSPMDPALTFAGTDLAVSNLVGKSGAVAADVMFLAFGWSAHLLPAGLALCGAMLLRHGLPDLRSWPEGLIRVAGFAAVLVSMCVLTRLHAADDDGLPAGPGGAVGASIVAVGLPILNWVGLTLCAVAALLVGSQAVLRYSWLRVLEQTGRGVHASAQRVVALAVALTAATQRSSGLPKAPRRAWFARPWFAARRTTQADAESVAEVLPADAVFRDDASLPSDDYAPPSDDYAPPSSDYAPSCGDDGAPASEALVSLPIVEAAPEERSPVSKRQVRKEPTLARPGGGSIGKPQRKEPVVDVARAERTPSVEVPAPSVLEEPQPSLRDHAVEELQAAPPPQPAAEAATRPAPIAPAVPEAAAAQEAAPRAGVAIDVRKPASGAESATALPALSLLENYERSASGGYSKELLEDLSRLLEERLADFRVEAKVVSALPGPVVTRFELELAKGTRVSKISALAKDLARSLAVVSVRIVEVIPGKSVVGIEIPNEQRETVRLKEILDAPQVRRSKSPLTLALGKDIAGAPVMADIGKMPHLLVAGTTGSGKSVSINAMLLSMLYKATPDDLRLILVDPKMLELAVYDHIPHLLTPVVTDMKDAAQALNWCVAEMERRYQLMAALGVRNLGGYNKRIDDAQETGGAIPDPLWPTGSGEPPPALARLPFIVVVIDEFADMMMVVGKKVEQLIARIAQKARAAGIHLLLATQRPSADVITGLIKANIPARIAFQVSSDGNSRIILDQGGAEHLLGHGDMLFLQPGTSAPNRVHGAFVSDEEVHAVAADWKSRGAPDYIADLLEGAPPDAEIPGTVDFGDGDAESEPLYDEAVAFVLESRRASISAVQRKLRIGYNRAARLIEAMEQAGIVSAMNSSGGRDVLVPNRADDAA